jgi:putative oxidoreductase
MKVGQRNLVPLADFSFLKISQMLKQISLRLTGLSLLRLAVAFIFLTHSVKRIGLGPEGFGEFLASKGFPFGTVLAWGVTLFELVGAPLLAFGVATRIVAAVFIVELLFGIALVHWPEGWFVVGAGRNGFEYSFLLIVSLLAIITGEKTDKKI